MAVIFAVMAGGQLFGFLGMLLALPVAAVVNVLLRYAQERYPRAACTRATRPASCWTLRGCRCRAGRRRRRGRRAVQ
jgi:hypothetical protein